VPFFCDNFVKSFYIGVIYVYTYTLINLEQNDKNHQSPSILLCEMQHTYVCYDQRRFRHIIIVLNV